MMELEMSNLIAVILTIEPQTNGYIYKLNAYTIGLDL